MKSIEQGVIQKGGRYDGKKGHVPARYVGPASNQKDWPNPSSGRAGTPKKWGSDGKGANGRGMPECESY